VKFVKGTSGNPKGRPNGSLNLQSPLVRRHCCGNPEYAGGIVLAFLGTNSANVLRLGGQRRTWASGSPGSTVPTPCVCSASRSKNWTELPDDAQPFAGRRRIHRWGMAFTGSPYSRPYRRSASPSEKRHGGGGNRTPVRKPSALRLYVCSPRFSLGLQNSHGRDLRSPVPVISPTWPQASRSASPHSDGPAPTHGPRSGGPRTTAG